ncbi:uncharacterized protein LOC132556583 [Ylistrum balloti]|uniref:uncharacterized protein LOC132556583 n=1 Tax=Ylistrum balloti TaxID=509963 RepID=UPI002905BB57|nr:uncharacterized protein LOC132556583 [Ylistrum balloti]
MRLPTEANHAETTKNVVPVDLDVLIGKLKENLTMKTCREKVDRRHNVRPSPYCIPRKTSPLPNRTLVPSGAAENVYHSQGFIKCSKCFQRHCKCSYTDGSSIMILKHLLREQTLIQEAVRRLQDRTDRKGEHVLCRPCSPSVDESDWHSEGFTTQHTSYESEIDTPLESDIDS